jgi:hypothetical protein
MSKPFQAQHDKLKEGNRQREQNRKKKLFDQFNWTESRFYGYAQMKGWIGKGNNNLLKMKYLTELTNYLEKETDIKKVRTNRRYKKGLLKYIDDNFEQFQPFLNSYSFPTEEKNKPKIEEENDQIFIFDEKFQIFLRDSDEFGKWDFSLE